MIRQIVLEDRPTGKKSVGLVMTSGDIGDYEMARLGERLIRAGGPNRGYLDGGVRYQFRALDEEVPGLEYQTMHIDVLHAGDGKAGPTYQDILDLEKQIEENNRRSCPDGLFTQLLEDMRGIEYHRSPETQAAADWAKAYYPPLRGVEITSENYQRALARAQYLMDAEAGSLEADEMSDLAEKIQEYEERRYKLTEVLGPDLAADVGITSRPCDRLPDWLLPLAAAVVVGLIGMAIAGVR